MERPEYEKYRYAKRRLYPIAYFDKIHEYIDYLENKESGNIYFCNSCHAMFEEECACGEMDEDL